MNQEKPYTTPMDAQRFDLRHRQKETYRLKPASDERRVRARSASAPGMLEGRTKHTNTFPRHRQARKNSDSNSTQPSPSRSKLTCLSQKAFTYLSDYRWSLEGGSRLFCGCVSVDPFERGIISKQGAEVIGPIEIHVEMETVAKSEAMWTNPVEAVLFEGYPAVDVVSAHIC